MKKKHLQTVNKLENIFHQHKINFLTSHYLQYNISKDWLNLEKSLCAATKTESQSWKPVFFRPSGSCELETGVIK